MRWVFRSFFKCCQSFQTQSRVNSFRLCEDKEDFYKFHGAFGCSLLLAPERRFSMKDDGYVFLLALNGTYFSTRATIRLRYDK